MNTRLFRLYCFATIAALPALASAAEDKPRAGASASNPAKSKKRPAGDKAPLRDTKKYVKDVQLKGAVLRGGQLSLTNLLDARAGTIGVTVAPTDSVLRDQLNLKKEQPGVVVTQVLKDSAAAKAGVKTNDILLTVNDKPVASGAQLKNRVQAARDKPVKLKLLRKARHITLSITPPRNWETARLKLDDRLHAYDILVARHPGDHGSKYIIGVNTKPVDATLAAQLVIPPSTGLILTNVTPKSPAEKAGLQKHDVLLTAGDQYISQVGDLGKVLDKAAGKPVKLEFLRAGRKHSCTVTPKKRVVEDRVFYWNLDRGGAGYGAPGFFGEMATSSPGWGGIRSMAFSPDGKRLYAATLADLWQTRTGNLKSQVDRLSRQLSELQKTVNELKKALAAQAKKPKKK